MNKPCLAVTFCICFFFNLKAAENYPSGARAVALSNAFVSVSDIWGTFHNQAGLTTIENIKAGVFYESRFLTDELSHVAGTLAIPVKPGTFGASFSQFGKGTYKEHKIGLAFAGKLSNRLSAAIQLDYLSEHYPENERARGFATFETGIVYAATDEFFLGAHIFNPVRGGIKTPGGIQKMPAILRFGGHYQFPKMVLVVLETEKATNKPVVIKSGIEFSPAQHLMLRFGVSGKPVTYTSGIGFLTGKIVTDIGFAYHGNLGITPAISVQLNL